MELHLGQWLERKAHDIYARMRSNSERGEEFDIAGLNHLETLLEASEEGFELPLERQFYADCPESVKLCHRPAKLFELTDGYIVADDGFVFDRDGGSLTTAHSPELYLPGRVRHPIPCLSHRIEGSVFNLAGKNSNSHGHFLVQHLPRIISVWERLERDTDIKILLSAKNFSWQSRYLRELGISSERLIRTGSGTLSVEHLLYVPPFHSDPHIYTGIIYQKLREALGWTNRAAGDRVIFLSRGQTGHRRLLNEAECVEVAKDIWPQLELLDLADHTLSEQMNILSQSNLVIGGHGQAFAGQLFTNRAIGVLLQAGDGPMKNCWANSFRNVGIQMDGDGVVLYSENKPNRFQDDWIFKADLLKKQLRRLKPLIDLRLGELRK